MIGLPNAETTGGPATNIAEVSFTMMEKCVAASRAAPSPATLPSPSPTQGTRERLSPVWWYIQVPPTPPGRLARPVVSMVLTEPPPPEPSMMRMIGSLRSAAMRSAMIGLSRMVASALPPRTVKSSPQTTTGRPSTWPRPITQLLGVKSTSSLSASYCALPAMAPTSWKLPASSTWSTRSRTVSRPPACWRATLSAPPMRLASASRWRSSASSGSQLLSGGEPA